MKKGFKLTLKILLLLIVADFLIFEPFYIKDQIHSYIDFIKISNDDIPTIALVINNYLLIHSFLRLFIGVISLLFILYMFFPNTLLFFEQNYKNHRTKKKEIEKEKTSKKIKELEEKLKNMKSDE